MLEVMIVVAIVALLALFALPGFLRARKRSQAVNVLHDARILDAAVDQYAAENNLKGTDSFDPSALRTYFQPSSRFYSQATTTTPAVGRQPSRQVAANGPFTDVMGGRYIVGDSVDAGVRIDPTTESNLGDVIDNPSSFWGSYY